MITVILCGGLGTRLSEETVLRPKPMVAIGNRPILWHLMQLYAHHGQKEFMLALGYKGEVIKQYFADYAQNQSDLTVDLASGEVRTTSQASPDWLVHLIDTGDKTQTGGRLKRLTQKLENRGTFMVTYGDGLSNVDISAVLRYHRQHGRLATITAVRPPARFGAIELEDGRVLKFQEKPQSGEGWINGGFFVLEPEVLSYLENDQTVFEAQPLESLARDGQLMAYRHEGFWQPMDTLRDKNHLEQMWERGAAPWKVW